MRSGGGQNVMLKKGTYAARARFPTSNVGQAATSKTTYEYGHIFEYLYFVSGHSIKAETVSCIRSI